MVEKLHFTAVCVPPGRTYYSRILNVMRNMSKSGQVTVSGELAQDVAWWNKFAICYNGLSLIPFPFWDNTNTF